MSERKLNMYVFKKKKIPPATYVSTTYKLKNNLMLWQQRALDYNVQLQI